MIHVLKLLPISITTLNVQKGTINFSIQQNVTIVTRAAQIRWSNSPSPLSSMHFTYRLRINVYVKNDSQHQKY